nr:reverse transcriptase domain-containing protein [Tanacetum cinerariifolium]
MKEVDRETIMKLEMKMIAKDGTISKFSRKFPRYTPSKEKEEEPEKKGSKETPEKGPNYEFLSYAVSDSESDLESTTRSEPKCNELEDTCESGEMALNRRSGNDDNENPDIVAIIAQQLQNILPQIITQVTNNANTANANGSGGNGNSGNNGCSYKGFMACNPKEYDGKGGAIALTRWIEKMEYVIENSGCVENQKNDKTVGANHATYTDQFHELAKLVLDLVSPESSRIK